MSDVLIRGVDMPEDCESCRLNTTDAFGRLGCRASGYIPLRKAGQTRPSWCPLIALPNHHGPLIDADKLTRHYAWWGECENKTLFDAIIDQQEVVVPADAATEKGEET